MLTFLKIGHGHEERLNMKGYIVFIPKKYSEFALGQWKKIIRFIIFIKTLQHKC